MLNQYTALDAVGAVTSYGYDVMGQTIAVTNALGNVTVYEYDLRGNKTYEGGATYPVRYAYDAFGNRTAMTTYRDEASGIGDTTTWTYDEASGLLLAKTYADGKGLSYTYTNDGRLATRTNARNIVTTYAYDAWGQLFSIDYADTTPDIAYIYDAMGRQISATDAVGTTTFTYDAFGQLTAEQVSGLYSKILTRHWDTFGRNVGYSVDGDRKQSITYDSATGRIAESDGFAWDYLANSNLKSKLTYPSGAMASWDYETKRDLLTKVTNAHADGTEISSYIYTNDFLGRRTSKNDEQYGYNARDELTSADEVSYNYDDIGNRTTAEGKTYTANNLNQYTAIDDFAPQYDADGNQTLIKTETGIWSVVYNAENRPIRWTQGDTVITMAFDRMGRRVEMRTVKDGEETLQRFVYDNYLCVQQLRGADNALFHSYVWDPTEPIATRPLIFLPAASSLSYYFHDGNKNVSDLMDIHGSVVHYDYTPFGTLVISTSTENPFRFSSELYDDILGLVYYNYRHYSPKNGRWCGRDPISDYTNGGEYLFSSNSVDYIDFLGLEKCHVVRNQLNLTLPSNSLKVSGFIRYDEETCEGCCNNVLLDKYKITKRISGGITIKGKAPVPYLSFGSTGTGLFVTGSGTLLANASYSRNLCDNQVTVSGGGSLVFYGGLKLALVDFSALEISVTGELGVSASLTVVCNDDSCALQGRACFNARLLGTVKIWKFTRNNIQQSKFCTEPLTFLSF